MPPHDLILIPGGPFGNAVSDNYPALPGARRRLDHLSADRQARQKPASAVVMAGRSAQAHSTRKRDWPSKSRA